jgi:peptidoglycan/LPS O-acetylase OafA/YrhL
MNLTTGTEYRPDIDGVRMIAVTAVLLFHSVGLPFGYLGVDVFFVISGFLITGIIYRETEQNRFSVASFYMRRVRRILPLTLTAITASLVLGLCWMLPDDLENLAQSIIATNFCANNILQILTTKNYWDVVNEFKPLMHTWSLGVEEQYYLLYPFFIAPLARRGVAPLITVLSFLAGASFLAFSFFPSPDYEKFYLIHFRFWELAVGGIAAVLVHGRHLHWKWAKTGALVALLAVMVVPVPNLSADFRLVLAVVFTTMLLSLRGTPQELASRFLEHRLAVNIGKISFSLYIWHQIVLAFARYAWVEQFDWLSLSIAALLTCGLSVVSYHFIEQPFRNPNRITTRIVFSVLGLAFILTTTTAFALYTRAGVIHDVPELGISANAAQRGMHGAYNDRINHLPRKFQTPDKIRVLVIGDSFARDWANVLLESPFASSLEIIYPPGNPDDPALAEQITAADVVFVTWAGIFTQDTVACLRIPPDKLWVVGTKAFGTSNGIFYNRQGRGYLAQRAPISPELWNLNLQLANTWDDRYLNCLGKVADANQRVPVFTPSGQFISQDCRHFTRAGAAYFSELFQPELRKILQIPSSVPSESR